MPAAQQAPWPSEPSPAQAAQDDPGVCPAHRRGRRPAAAAEQQLEDTLASAAQQQLAALQRAGGGCLLAVDRMAWEQAALSCGIAEPVLAALQQGQVGSSPYRVLAYRLRPATAAGTTAELELQLSGERPWRAAYRVQLAPAAGGSVQITALQELGLRGARA